MDKDKLEIIDKTTDLIFLAIAILQQISGKSQGEILDAILTEGAKTDQLLEKLR